MPAGRTIVIVAHDPAQALHVLLYHVANHLPLLFWRGAHFLLNHTSVQTTEPDKALTSRQWNTCFYIKLVCLKKG